MIKKSAGTKRHNSVTVSKKTRKKPDALTKIAIAALEDMKAVNVKVLDVRKLTDVADTMIVASGQKRTRNPMHCRTSCFPIRRRRYLKLPHIVPLGAAACNYFGGNWPDWLSRSSKQNIYHQEAT